MIQSQWCFALATGGMIPVCQNHQVSSQKEIFTHTLIQIVPFLPKISYVSHDTSALQTYFGICTCTVKDLVWIIYAAVSSCCESSFALSWLFVPLAYPCLH